MATESSQHTVEKVGEGGAEITVNEEISHNSPKKRKLTSDVWNNFLNIKGLKERQGLDVITARVHLSGKVIMGLAI